MSCKLLTSGRCHTGSFTLEALLLIFRLGCSVMVNTLNSRRFTRTLYQILTAVLVQTPQDARVPGSKALLKSRKLQKLLRRQKFPGGASTTATPFDAPANNPPQRMSESRSLVEAVSEGLTRKASERNVLSRKASAASVLPTTASEKTLLSRKASAPSVLSRVRGAPAGSQSPLEIVVDRR